MKKRLLIIRSALVSTWGSCKVIAPNLQQCYQNLSGPDVEIKFFEISKDFIVEDSIRNGSYILGLADLVKNFEPTEMIFTDHLPNPADVVMFLSILIPIPKLPPIVFHLYGDFTFFAKHWVRAGEGLKGHKVKIVVASESQANLLRNFSNENTCIETFLFPVNEGDYYYDHDERIETRKQNQVRDYDQVILYSGRISLQKNVDLVIREYAEICKNSVFPTKLWIVGSFDDQGALFQGVVNHEGYTYSKLAQLISTLPQEISSTIKIWGMQSKDTLRKLKNASDMFMSFSLHHDEDFGMSPAEALACGLPSLLTDWGGYSSFISKRWFCQLVPVEITHFGHQLRVAKVHEFFNMFTLAYINHSDRSRWSKEFLKEFSISSATEKLRVILNKDFETFHGFNWSLLHFHEVYWKIKMGEELNVHLTPSCDNLYYKIYKPYISGKNT
jgi:glycosyltransferase involved in cell wall biosynthesis